jgi:hypothetical protein
MTKKRPRKTDQPEQPTDSIASGWEDDDLNNLFDDEELAEVEPYTPKYVDSPRQRIDLTTGPQFKVKRQNRTYMGRMALLIDEAVNNAHKAETLQQREFWRGAVFALQTALSELGVSRAP